MGFSTSGPAQADAIRAALAVTVDGEPLFRTVQATYNALETSAGPALAEAHDAGLTVIVKEGMANGRLAAPHAPDAVRAVAEEAGLGSDAVALALVLRQPWAGVVLSGAATSVQLSSNLHAAVVDLDDEQLSRLAGAGRGAGGVLGAARAAALALISADPQQGLRGRTPEALCGERYMPPMRH